MFVRSLDIGGSQTRIASSREEITVYESTYMEISLDMPAKTYIEEKRNDFIIINSPRATIMQKRYAKGVAMNYFQGKVVVTDNQSAKVEQDSTYVNAVYAIACELLQSGVYFDEVKIGVCIPTAEFYSDNFDYVETLKEGLRGNHKIFFPLLDKTVEFNIGDKNVYAFPEGVVAAFQFSKDKGFVGGTTLVIDAGYRSTDITILKAFKPLGKGARSIPAGGINIEAILIGELERNNLMVSREEARVALGTGVIAEGSKETPIDKEVYTARYKFASDLKNSIIDVLSYNMMNIRSINNVMFVGRPFMGEGENCLKNILLELLGSDLHDYPIENLDTANVVEAIGVMKRGA